MVEILNQKKWRESLANIGPENGQGHTITTRLVFCYCFACTNCCTYVQGQGFPCSARQYIAAHLHLPRVATKGDHLGRSLAQTKTAELDRFGCSCCKAAR